MPKYRPITRAEGERLTRLERARASKKVQRMKLTELEAMLAFTRMLADLYPCSAGGRPHEEGGTCGVCEARKWLRRRRLEYRRLNVR